MPKSPEELRGLAVEFLRLGELDQAERVATRLLAAAPGDVDGLLILGAVHAAHGRWAACVQVLSPIRTDPRAARRLTRAYWSLGLPEEALQCAETAAEWDQIDVDALCEIGLLALAVEAGTLAVTCFRRAAAAEPESPTIRHNLARSLILIGDLEGAEAEYREAIRLAPEAPNSYIGLARVQQSLGLRGEAIDNFRYANRLEPESARGLEQLIEAQTEAGEFAEAEETATRLLRIDGDSDRSHRTLAYLQKRQGKVAQASETLGRAVGKHPLSARSHFDLAYSKRLTEADRSLIGRIEKLARMDSYPPADRALLHYALGKAYDDLGEFDKAIGHFDEANELMHAQLPAPFDAAEQSAYVSELIETFTPEFLQSHRQMGSESDLPIFIVGMIRSGTTLVDQIVSAHPDVASGGELPFWATNGKGFIEKRTRVDASKLKALQVRYLELLGGLGKGKAHVTDKMPHNFAAIGLIHLAFPKARIVHCMRHPVDNCLSAYVTPYRGVVRYGHNREAIVAYYRQYRRLMDHWRKVLPPDVLCEVEYEELVECPEEVTRRLVNQLELPWSDACLHPEANSSSANTPSMWQVRQPIFKSSRGRWKNYEPWLGAFSELA